MKNKHLTTSIIAAFTFVMTEASQAEETPQKCQINGPDGKSLIKAGKADCAGGGNSCSGSNPEGDPSAWLLLPYGVCEKIKGGVVVK
ncbi:MAG: DUF2282 domain-containing protein [Proteobacteria bacterium]|nr:DUF2282 domain-containing protein [Pseudomonadota bacterium]